MNKEENPIILIVFQYSFLIFRISNLLFKGAKVYEKLSKCYARQGKISLASSLYERAITL